MELQNEFKKLQQEFIEYTKVDLDHFLGFTRHVFLLTNFSQCQMVGPLGGWYSAPFYSHAGGYKLKLNVDTKESGRIVDVYLQLQHSEHKLDFPVTFIVTLHLLNQLSNQNHYSKNFEFKFATFDDKYSNCGHYIPFKELYKKDKLTQYLKSNCLKFCMCIKIK